MRKQLNRPASIRGLVSIGEAKRAIYIDFEGVMDAPPVLLGAYWIDDKQQEQFTQFVFDQSLRAAATAKSKESGGACRYVGSLEEAVQAVVSIARSEDRLLVAWSSYEESVVNASALDPNVRLSFNDRIRDAKVPAKRWKRRFYPDVIFPRKDRGGRNSLVNFCKLISFPIPTTYGPAASRIRHVTKQLIRRGSYDRLTRVVKTKWTNLLRHNEIDCRGTREVLIQAVAA